MIKSIIAGMCLLVAGMASVGQLGKKTEERPYFESNGLAISEGAWKLILEYEVGGGQPYYDRNLVHPEWPEGASGVTIGIGYDLGYNSRAQIISDWSALPKDELRLLANCAGLKGNQARLALKGVDSIRVPWGTAVEVYKTKTVPRFALLTIKAYPGIQTLHPTAQGVLLSWVFNRGDGVGNGPRDLEKRQIRAAVPDEPWLVSGYIDHSSRIWIGASNGKGLVRRRVAECALWRTVYPPKPP